MLRMLAQLLLVADQMLDSWLRRDRRTPAEKWANPRPGDWWGPCSCGYRTPVDEEWEGHRCSEESTT